ncbi:MAG TPA: DUF389 domain-containing protein [Polyangiaceae bacterium]|nr:DUF389 domain-containing protein [Polyangiaceae bacterium]
MQDRLVRLLGNSVEGRAALVAGMLRRDAREATSYWLQLLVSIGIATLGLVVGSSAVVIGAMLVAPLMGPIVGLAMGLAAGSPFLVLRSAGRVALSIMVAVGGAAVITALLPFHELNAEISARTSPTVLDLITAGFCALAGVYSSLRPGSDTAATAAGTSIGISLVPPLCASGYGVGTSSWSIAGGSALLFLTNFVAIVVVGTAAFLAGGFNRVDVTDLEREELGKAGETAPIARALALRLARLFESRWGPVLRFLMPFAFLAAVYVPLRRALDEVAWEVRVRAAVRRSLAAEPARVVQSHVVIERHEVELVMVLLGTTRDADAARARLGAEIRQVAGVRPRLEILAVPDATAFAGLESTLLTPHEVKTATAPPPPSPGQELDDAASTLRATVSALWPKAALGDALAVDLDAATASSLRLRIVHLGTPLSRDGAETLRQAIGARLARDVQLIDVAIPDTPLVRAQGDLAFVAGVAAGVRATASLPSVNVCVTTPPEAARASAADLEFARTLDGLLASHPRVTRTPGDAWSVRFSTDPCAAPSGLDGGLQDGGDPDAGVPDAAVPDAGVSNSGG